MPQMPASLPFGGKTRFILRRNAEGKGPWRVVMEHPAPDDERRNIFTDLLPAKAEADYRNARYKTNRNNELLYKLLKADSRWCDLTASEKHMTVELLNVYLSDPSIVPPIWPVLPDHTDSRWIVSSEDLYEPSFCILDIRGKKRLAAVSHTPRRIDPHVVVFDSNVSFYSPRSR